MIVYFNDDFEDVSKELATMAKVIPLNGDPPYFIKVEANSEL
jgi:hypothetical protein